MSAWLRLFMPRRIGWLTGAGTVGCCLVLAAAVLGPSLAPHPVQLVHMLENVDPPKQPPSLTHPFGTDWHGLDVFSKVLWGARYSLTVGLASTAVSMLIGLFVGLTSGYFGGFYDGLWMRLVDVVLAFPSLLLAILIAASLEPGLLTIFLALSMVSWAQIARLIRSLVLSLREQEFVVAAVALGASHCRVILAHILPNLLPTLVVIFSTRIGVMILSEASLNFLGLGAPSEAPSWGVMVFFGMDHFNEAAWCSVFPATAIALTVFSFNLVGDGVRDALDPRLKDAA
ncbi:MAG: ABC transporter permease [Candidatus Riflebacteria bacterium]|nr:ABC transporter permease [Candidatus Riflebacteria bacterium]